MYMYRNYRLPSNAHTYTHTSTYIKGIVEHFWCYFVDFLQSSPELNIGNIGDVEEELSSSKETGCKIPSGKRLHNHGKTHFQWDNSLFLLAMFNSYLDHYQRVPSMR